MKENREEKPVALVTGAAKGIGAACCLALAREGYRLGIHFRRSEKAAKEVLRGVTDGFLLRADLTEPDQIEAMVKEVSAQAGRLDVLVNNAGMSINQTMMQMKMGQFDSQRALLRGTWYLVKRILRTFMLRQASGRIINISSVVAHTGHAGQVPYTMEKAGVDALTKSMAQELCDRGILVNSVAPGFIQTDMTEDLPETVREGILEKVPLRRLGRPEEVADVVAFLASRGTYIQGSVIHVNGGLYSG